MGSTDIVRVAERRKKDVDMMKGKGKNKGFGKGKNPPQQQMLFGKCEGGYGKDWTWSDSWDSSRKGKSGVILLRKSMRGSLEMAPLCLDWK